MFVEHSEVFILYFVYLVTCNCSMSVCLLFQLRHEPTYSQQEEQLREQMEVPTEQQGKEGAQRTRARKRLRSMARVGLAASKV